MAFWKKGQRTFSSSRHILLASQHQFVPGFWKGVCLSEIVQPSHVCMLIQSGWVLWIWRFCSLSIVLESIAVWIIWIHTPCNPVYVYAVSMILAGKIKMKWFNMGVRLKSSRSIHTRAFHLQVDLMPGEELRMLTWIMGIKALDW